MKDEIKTVIKDLAEKSNETPDSADALRLTQAALNLSHVLQILKEVR